MADNNMTSKEYADLKRQEKAEVFETLSAATQKLLSGSKLKEYADKQAQLFKHSVSNVLLIMEQMPEASWVRSYDDWQKDGVQVLKGETGIRTLGSYRYQKEDGSMGMGSKVVKMFDVSQTAIKDFDIEGPSYRKMPEAFMLAFPAAVEVPEVRMVWQVANAVKIPVMGMGGVATWEDAVEIMMGNNYNTREDVIHQAELSAYILTKHYGYDAPDINFGEMSEKYPGKEESEVRGQLGIIKHTAETIDNRVQEALELNRADKYRGER